MRRTGVLTLSAAVAFACAGCATLMSGTTQRVSFKSNPPGAHVVFGNQSGTTPVTLEIPKGHKEAVAISNGSDTRLISLERKVNPYTWLNLIPPLWPGFIVDAVSGAMMTYEADVVTLDFHKNEYSLTKLND